MGHDDEGSENRRDEFAYRPFETPAVSRLAIEDPARCQILAAHEHALDAGDAGYLDPVSGLFVLTARFLADRGYCCERGCRHCPYVADETG